MDAFLYAEAVGITGALTGMTKMAVRRPRPKAYAEAALHRDDPSYSNSDTDSALSFFSGHAAIAGTVTATATYLAFARSPSTARPWITLLAGTALTSFVSYARVRDGAHFPTDVIAGAVAGAGIGILVPHLHRSSDAQQRRVWVGFAPPDASGGGAIRVGGLF